jgi:Leucine-rich repeat (LRR) protein
LSKLRRFEIRGNRLTTLEGIGGLKSLEYMTVSCNTINEVKLNELTDYPSLTEIGLFGNYLGDETDSQKNKLIFEELMSILSKKAPNLKVIYIGGNHFVGLSDYVKEYIVKSFKNITRIDGDNI